MKPVTHLMTFEEYEEAIRERFASKFLEPTFSIIGGPRTFRTGRYSDVPRQIDVGVVRKETSELVLVADAKRRGAALDVNDVESFLGYLDDIGCRRGVLASILGGSPAARRRADAGNVKLDIVSYEEALSYDWSHVAMGIYPWDKGFHPVLAEALRLLNRGRVEDFIESLEPLPFEEWEALFVHLAADARPFALRALFRLALCGSF